MMNLNMEMNNVKIIIVVTIILCIMMLIFYTVMKKPNESYKDLDWKAQLKKEGELEFLIKHDKKENFGVDWAEKLKKQGVIQFMAKEGMKEPTISPLTNSGVGIVFDPINTTMPILESRGQNVHVPNSYTYSDKTTNMDTLYTLPADEKVLESSNDYSDNHLSRVRSRIDAFSSYKPRTVADTRNLITQENEKNFS